MSKSKHKGTKPSRADLLIEQAVRAVEEKEKTSPQNFPTTEEVVRTTGPIAKIDLQQFIEKEAYLRLAADYENFRKRAQRDRVEAERTGRERVLREFLEVLDNFERGLAQARDDRSPLADGMRMILSQVESWFKSEGLERIETIGQLFDPAVHEAVVHRSDSSQPTGMILEEVRRGYRWPDRLVRAANVVVCKNESEKEKA